jgi:hypothetical protein
MSNNIRIRTTPNEFKSKAIKINLEQDFDFLEILSLSISQEEVYKRYCSDYGAVVGRVIMNNGVGIPNVKVSVFIPLDENDVDNYEISGLYPFESLKDTDIDGKRYNLLPDSHQFDCHTPIGTFRNKREVLDNDTLLDIHCKYYKYTAITNESGDFMIFGVPTGTHLINVDCDLSDIGIYSQRPYDFMREGQPKSAFDTSNKFKYGDDLDKLVQVKSQRTSVNVVPFWGDTEQCEIGITRIDFDLKHELKPSAIFMGSIFGDNEKNSINKRCKPRKKLGSLCETITSQGTIEMLRKDINGHNEQYDVQGGRLIDDDGAWAYQVPMNLDYMVTNEFGQLVPSEDPSKGIPTRAEVRFRIGMDVTGGEGKLRTRAKYLIPNNPNNYGESDYTFDERTKDYSFRNIYWNKIYSVKNFIPRYQTIGGGPFQADVRAMTGIKDVDDCTGYHNPFPFNRMDSDVNPLFSILCIIIGIVSFIVVLINSVIINLINGVIFILNAVLAAICEVIFFIGKIVCALRHPTCASCRASCRQQACIGSCAGDCDNCLCGNIIPYIPCITLKCQGEEYGPGCLPNSLSWNATNKPPMAHWPDDGHLGHGYLETAPPADGGWASCTSFSLAEALDVWEFDFYNDWINGTLYSFLLKYKKKRRGKEKFCEYDCDDFGNGTDGDNNGNSDNNCKNNWLVDTCTDNGVKSSLSDNIKDGLVKKFEDELYYASYTHNGDYKLFATDIIDLGAMFECDWQGRPKLQPYLVPTTYNAPDLLDEFDEDTNELITSGYDSSSLGLNNSLFFEINCLGIFTNAKNCSNIKRQCEFGVGLDEYRSDESAFLGCGTIGTVGYGNVPLNGGAGEVDREIGNCDIDNLLSRDIFTLLNNPNAGIDLNDNTTEEYHALFDIPNGAYSKFRSFDNSKIVKQPRGNSYYFYFGLNPGRTGLDLMNKKYFEVCNIPVKNDYIISGNTNDSTTINGCNGTIDIQMIGGSAPFTFEWIGPNGFNSSSQNITNLCVGTYTVIVTDSLGSQVSQTFTINQPFSVSCFASPTPVSQNGASDGAINIVGIGGGNGGPYTTSITGPVSSTHTGVSGPTDIFTGLPSGVYTVTTSDINGNMASCTTTGVTITTPPPLIITGNSTNVTCYGGGNGVLNLGYVSGIAPIIWSVTGPSMYNSTTTTNTNLQPGTYNVTATDSIGQTQTLSFVIIQPTMINGSLNATNITCNGANNGYLNGTIYGGTPPYTYSWSGPTVNPITNTTASLGPIGNITYPAGTYTLSVVDANNCTKDFTATVKEPSVIDVQIGSVTNVTCNGGSNGSVTLSATGGNPSLSPANGTYQYRIGSGAWQASPTFNGLSAGSYTFSVKDINNCTDSVVISVTEPTVVTLSVLGQTNTTITVSGSGGNGGPYEFRHRTSPSGTWSSWTTTSIRSGLTPSTNYDLQSRDSQACESSIVTHSTI